MLQADRAWEDSNRPPPERALWSAVLLQVIDDMGRGEVPSGYLTTLDFKTVCELAGLEPAAARDGIMRRIQVKATM